MDYTFKIVGHDGDIYTVVSEPDMSDEEYFNAFNTKSRQFRVIDCTDGEVAAYAIAPTDYNHLVYVNENGTKAFDTAYQKYQKSFRVYRSQRDTNQFRFYRNDTDCDDEGWILVGWYHPHQKRLGFPPYAIIEKSLSRDDTNYVAHTVSITVKRVA